MYSILLIHIFYVSVIFRWLLEIYVRFSQSCNANNHYFKSRPFCLHQRLSSIHQLEKYLKLPCRLYETALKGTISDKHNHNRNHDNHNHDDHDYDRDHDHKHNHDNHKHDRDVDHIHSHNHDRNIIAHFFMALFKSFERP